MRNTGIYQIRNKINHKLYIGSALNLKRRERKHFHDLKHNKHKNSKLQNAYNKYGSDNFVFEIICYCDKELLISIEQKHIDFHGIENLYNICPIAGSQFGFRHSEESKKKMSESLRGHTPWNKDKKGTKHSEETKTKMSDARIGKTHSEESKQKMSERTFSEEHRQNLSNALKGKFLSSETRKKISEAKKGQVPWNKGKTLENRKLKV